ncbi:hypothetical protein [Polaromonas jejuensis]|uniref:Uncharacterized protein n=1 Tax=Polaromonas jejuensis TaxID=457502 RepID=A0ABW0Q7E2_9BURK
MTASRMRVLMSEAVAMQETLHIPCQPFAAQQGLFIQPVYKSCAPAWCADDADGGARGGTRTKAVNG